ncbi:MULTISPECIES: hypothetical protein [Paenibacillus]|uniref:Uncharacterized protein n=1 Tax=Paenibacillus naphthalenovorans TaxID=162209 RepID=A0A0U2WCP3_9BACL|nr:MULTISPECIES: hypothetical protein [Paenibacillus]ALS25253.1 hypothetical protein IJ22_49910 [Paenibacillus naphthalenovorans]NTZ20160.1 hypothetical protein [Paenibacillus sp. JMULE4]GCL73362.1 hypothetical protein PN4B1_32990 [Paenibacillus naphthalenovorans]SDI31259.1 hypothetical protein SAMN05421868_10553 [Paenibacillus naphthalenovorans]
MNPQTARLLNLIQLISEIGIAAGYLIGMIPLAYAWSGTWVVPLAVVNLIIALLTSNGTLVMTIINVVLSLVSWIPIVGFVTRIGGSIVSVINIMNLRQRV